MGSFIRTHLALAAALAVVAGTSAPPPAAAQATGTVRGTVTSASTQRPLSGARVTVAGANRSVVTGASGEYVLANVPAGAATLRAELIGYSPAVRTATVAAGQTATVNFSLAEAAIGLDELVVTASGVARAREVGTSMSKISSKELETAPVQNVEQIIAGRAPGVTVIANSGQPGAGGTIRLRGNKSVSQGNHPLIYVDGVRIYSDNGPASWASHQGTLPLNDINAEDIERVEIVKGAAATTLYGTEAAGGVIQIFTKRGFAGKPMWNLEITQGVNNVGHVGPEEGNPTGLFFNQCRGPDLVAINFKNGQLEPFQDPTCPASGSWLRNGQIQRYSGSVRGGSDNTNYFLSGNFSDEEGVIDTGWSRDGGFRGNFGFQPTDAIDISLNTSFTKRTTRWVPDGNNASGFALNVTRGPANNFKDAKACTDAGITDCVVNARILEQENFNRNDHFITGFTVQHRAGERLTNRLTLGYDYNNADNETHYPFGYLRSPKGFLWTQAWKHTTLSVDYAGTFKTDVGSAFTSALSWGGQLFEDRNHYREADGYEFAGPGAPTLGSAARTEIYRDDRLRVINAGLFVEELVGWRDRLFLTAGMRVDGNSAFGKEFGLQAYPKVSAAYVISDHDFWPSSYLESMKLRAAVGESGKAPGAFDAVRTWSPIAGDDGQPAFTPAVLGNDKLGPERTREVEVGFEASALDGRVDVELTRFWQRTLDALVEVQPIPSQGFGVNTQLENVGEISNQGLELGVNAELVRARAVNWSARVNYATNRSEAVDLDGQDISLSWNNRLREGFPIPSFFGDLITNPGKFEEPVIVRDTFLGPAYPTRTIGIGTTLRVMERVTFDVLGEHQGGHFQLNGTGMQAARRGVWSPCYQVQQKLVAARTDPSAVSDVTALDRMKCAIDRKKMDYSWWIQPADFFKLRHASLTYDVPTRLIPGGRSASITFSGRNLFTSTDYDGLDPEANELGQLFRRVEYYNLPPTRSFLVSMRVGF